MILGVLLFYYFIILLFYYFIIFFKKKFRNKIKSPWFSTFSGMLEAIESRRGVSAQAVAPFLDAVVSHPFPGPGEKFTIWVNTAQNIEGLPIQYPLFRPDDTQVCQHHVVFPLNFLFSSLFALLRASPIPHHVLFLGGLF